MSAAVIAICWQSGAERLPRGRFPAPARSRQPPPMAQAGAAPQRTDTSRVLQDKGGPGGAGQQGVRESHMRGSPPIPGIPGDLGVDFKGDFFFFERQVSVPPAANLGIHIRAARGSGGGGSGVRACLVLKVGLCCLWTC